MTTKPEEAREEEREPEVEQGGEADGLWHQTIEARLENLEMLSQGQLDLLDSFRQNLPVSPEAKEAYEARITELEKELEAKKSPPPPVEEDEAPPPVPKRRPLFVKARRR